MKWAAAILVVLATGASSQAQNPKAKKDAAPAYYPMQLGSKWTYNIDVGGGQKIQTTTQIAKIETLDGQKMSRLDASVNGQAGMTEHLYATPKGVFRSRYNGMECVPPLCIVKYPIKEGETWEQDVKIGAEELKVSCVSGPAEEVTTPAGKYQAVSVRVMTTTNGMKIDATAWYAMNVGMVKQKMTIGDRTIALELTEFEAGK